MTNKVPPEITMSDEQRIQLLADIILETVLDHERVDRELKKKPNGYWFGPIETGGSCMICVYVTYEKMWQDKYGHRCKHCQKAYLRGDITKEIIMDPKGHKWISSSQLARYLDINSQLLKAEVSRGKYKMRSIKHPKYVDTESFQESENPIVSEVLKSLGKSSLPSYSGRVEFTADGTARPPAS